MMKTTVEECEVGVVNNMEQSASKSAQVRRVFENAPRYLSSKGVDIRVRAETVERLASRFSWCRLLDIGCGDGTISLPLLTDKSHLTLLDLSASMTAIASANVPTALKAQVEVRNENFMEAAFHPKSFDLIVTVGVLAHVDSPEAFISKIATLLEPGGRLIIEFTDCRHFVGCVGRVVGWFKEIVAPPKYHTNRLSFAEVSKILSSYGLKMVSTHRYATIPVPGIEKIVSREALHRIVTVLFGSVSNNRNAWLGNEYICLLTRA